MIHWTDLFFYGIGGILALILLADIFTEQSGGMWGGGKRVGDISFEGLFVLIILIIWVAIWGGILWW